jgi:uncharacterized protein (DUF1778 family)
MESRLNSRKEERIDVRLRREAKQLIARAAALTHQSLSDFVLTAVLERSREVIESSTVIQLNEEAATRFLEALATPPAPNAKLREAADLYRKALADGTLETS